MKKIIPLFSILSLFVTCELKAQIQDNIPFEFISKKTGKYWSGCNCENMKNENKLLQKLVKPTVTTHIAVPKIVWEYDRLEFCVYDSTGKKYLYPDVFEISPSALEAEMGPNPYYEYIHTFSCEKNKTQKTRLVIRGTKIIHTEKKIEADGRITVTPTFGPWHELAMTRPFLTSAWGEALPNNMISDNAIDFGSVSSGGGGSSGTVRMNDVVLNKPEVHPDGPYTNKSEDGTWTESGQYKDNKKIGTWKTVDNEKGSVSKEVVYAPDGSYKETNYLPGGSGTKQGVINYNAKGERNGIVQFYDSKGNIEDETTYLNGEQTGPHKSFSHSQLEKSGSYINGQQDGLWKFYDSKGVLESEHTYVKGTENGPCKFYYEGKLTSSGQYKDGKRDGPWKTYDDTGKIVKKTTMYKDGEPIE